MAKAVGIDLGTTNSVVGFKEARVEIVSHASNTPPERKLTKSLVAKCNGKIVVGEEAYNQLRNDPENVIISIKRLMGRGFGDEKVQTQKAKFGYKITAPTNGTENGLSVWLEGEEYQPEDISAHILRKIIQNVQEYRRQIGKSEETIDQAVITIPAYFNDKQKQATRVAAFKAGITPLELLPEPTAAAISYGFSADSADVKTILVYDFGGGTFDVSLITSTGKEFIESGKAGDLWLGGDNIDELIVELIKNKLSIQEGLNNVDGLIERMPRYERVQLKADLKVAAERAKIELTENSTATVRTSVPLRDEANFIVPIEVEITRSELESIVLPLVERSIQICQQALQICNYTADLIDVVLMVGGSSQIPIVQQKLKGFFGAEKVVIHRRPMYAVAEGAAIVAAREVGKVGSVSRDYCIRLADGTLETIIQQGDILPVQKLETYKTEADNQQLIHLEFLSPDRVKEELDGVKAEEKIGDMWLSLDSEYPKGTEIAVFYELDERETALRVTANLKNNPAIKVNVSMSRGKSDEVVFREIESFINEINQSQRLTKYGISEVTKQLAGLIQKANHIIQRDGSQERLDIKSQVTAGVQQVKTEFSDTFLTAESLIMECKSVMEFSNSLVPSLQKERLGSIVKKLETAISAKNYSGMEAHTEEARLETRLLSDIVKIILYIKQVYVIAVQINTNDGEYIRQKLYLLITAAESSDDHTVGKLLRELQPYIDKYSNEEIPVQEIITGITK